MRTLLVPLCALLLLSAPALSAPLDPRIKSAEALLRRGDADAAEKLLLQVTPPPPRALQLLGQVQVRLRKYEEAVKTYERYVAAETIPRKRSAGERLVSELKAAMKTRFKITTNPAGASVFVDSRAAGSVGKTPLSQLVSPGATR